MSLIIKNLEKASQIPSSLDVSLHTPVHQMKETLQILPSEHDMMSMNINNNYYKYNNYNNYNNYNYYNNYNNYNKYGCLANPK